MIEKLIIGIAAELIFKLVEKWARDPQFRVAVDHAFAKLQEAKSAEERRNASKLIQDAMSGDDR